MERYPIPMQSLMRPFLFVMILGLAALRPAAGLAGPGTHPNVLFIAIDDLDDVPEAGKKMAGLEGHHARMLESGRWKEAVQGYLAAIAYLDMNLGRLLDALERSPERDRTSIRPLLADPAAEWAEPAIMTHTFRNHAVRTADWRSIRYANGEEELDDEPQDPNESVNLAARPEHAAVKAALAPPLRLALFAVSSVPTGDDEWRSTFAG
jgi:arylsulfatase A-like enzyme